MVCVNMLTCLLVRKILQVHRVWDETSSDLQVGVLNQFTALFLWEPQKRGYLVSDLKLTHVLAYTPCHVKPDFQTMGVQNTMDFQKEL